MPAIRNSATSTTKRTTRAKSASPVLDKDTPLFTPENSPKPSSPPRKHYPGTERSALPIRGPWALPKPSDKDRSIAMEMRVPVARVQKPYNQDLKERRAKITHSLNKGRFNGHRIPVRQSAARVDAECLGVDKKFNYNIFLHDDVTGKPEIYQGNTAPYEHIGKPRGIKTPKDERWINHVQKEDLEQPERWNDPEHWRKVAEKTRSETERHRNLAELYRQKELVELQILKEKEVHSKSLWDRIRAGPRPLSLAERIRLDEAPTESTLPEGKRFRRSKVMNQEKEFWVKIQATSRRITRMYKKLEEEQKDGLIIQADFLEFKETFHKRTDRFKEVHWRQIRRDCDAIKNTPLNIPAEQLLAELVALQNQEIFRYSDQQK